MKKFCIAFIFLAAIIFQTLRITSRPIADEHFMVQINNLRTDNGMGLVTRKPLADALAEYIYNGYENFFTLLDKMETLGLGGQGKYPVYWNMHVRSSVAEQINSLDMFEQGFFVNPDVVYWGHYINRLTMDYLLVLIMDNPLFKRMDDYLDS